MDEKARGDEARKVQEGNVNFFCTVVGNRNCDVQEEGGQKKPDGAKQISLSVGRSK